MKTRIYIISLIFAFSACNDTLNVEPVTFTSGENYYETASQIETAVNGAYGKLQPLYTGDFYVFTEMRTDNTTFFFNPNNRCCVPREEVDYFLMNAVNDRVENVWDAIYSGIQQTNVVLNRIENVSFSDESKKNQFVGQAKFIRALLYFHLVRLYGPVPLKNKEIEDPSEVFTDERVSVDQVFQQIISDAEDAANKLAASYGSSDIGRATKGAALTLLGDVYMTQKDFSSAVSTLREVTNLNYSLVPNYEDVFHPNNKNNSESIFEVQYSASEEGENSNFIFLFGPWNASVALTGFQGQLGSMNIPTPSIIEAYEDGDERKEASVGYYVDPENSGFDEAIGDSLPFIKKYYHPPYARQGQTDENWPVYRYSDVLLMLAEAINEIEGPTNEAYGYINQVRQRAGLDNLTTGLTQPEFRESVYHEERVELAFENQRWFDLLRTGRALEVMDAHGVEEKQRLNRVTSEMFNVQEHQLLYPIPAKEVRLNGFDQNPGW